MNARQPGIEKNRRIEDLHDPRLKTLLDDLVGDNAASRSTADLDVAHRTLAASPESGRAKGRTRGWRWRRTRHRWPWDVAEVAEKGGGRRFS